MRWLTKTNGAEAVDFGVGDDEAAFTVFRGGDKALANAVQDDVVGNVELGSQLMQRPVWARRLQRGNWCCGGMNDELRLDTGDLVLTGRQVVEKFAQVARLELIAEQAT